MPASPSPTRWRTPNPRTRAALTYLALVPLPVAAVALLLGADIGSPGAPVRLRPETSAPGGATLLVALPLLLAAAWAAGRVARRLGQPAVVGEITVGVMLGPSLLGRVAPQAERWLFPEGLLPVLDGLAQVGLVLFMFLVGCELDLFRLRRLGTTATLVSHIGIAVPMLAGTLLAVPMYAVFAGPAATFPVFALFVGAVMGVTALPVLARLLQDRGEARSPLGVLALGCAALDDVTAWCLLALVSTLAQRGPLLSVLVTFAEAALFVALLAGVLRPLLTRLTSTRLRGPQVSAVAVLPFLLVGVMACAAVTDRIGVHPIFGAFLFGAVLPRDLPGLSEALEHLRSVVTVLLLPLFFVVSGLRTTLGVLGNDPGLWGWCGLVILVAVGSKAVAAAVAARAGGLAWPDAWGLGTLMNCRGLTGLIVLEVGLGMGVIGPLAYSLLVVMTLVSTALTTPMLCHIRKRTRGAAAAAGEGLPVSGRFPTPVRTAREGAPRESPSVR